MVLKSRQESAHARTFGGVFELKILRMRRFSSRFWTMDLKFPVKFQVTVKWWSLKACPQDKAVARGKKCLGEGGGGGGGVWACALWHPMQQ